MMNENPLKIPSKLEIANLPRRARIALAVRCCQRVQNLYQCAYPRQEHLDTIKNAIAQTINYCTNFDEFDFAKTHSLIADAQSSLPAAMSQQQHHAHVGAQVTCMSILRTIEAINFSNYASIDYSKVAIPIHTDLNVKEALIATGNGHDEEVSKSVFNAVECVFNLYATNDFHFPDRKKLVNGIHSDFTELQIYKEPWPEDPLILDDFFIRPHWPEGEPEWPKMEALSD